MASRRSNRNVKRGGAPSIIVTGGGYGRDVKERDYRRTSCDKARVDPKEGGRLAKCMEDSELM